MQQPRHQDTVNKQLDMNQKRLLTQDYAVCTGLNIELFVRLRMPTTFRFRCIYEHYAKVPDPTPNLRNSCHKFADLIISSAVIIKCCWWWWWWVRGVKGDSMLVVGERCEGRQGVGGGQASGLIKHLDQSNIWTSQASGLVKHLDQSNIWTSQTSGPIKQLDKSNIWTNQTSGQVKHLDQSSIWTSQTSGPIKYLDKSNIWTNQTSGLVKDLD
ncbi:hypothetical protein Btru_026765 [Bulinus truncatus]|nr:hypothetical protein Btru_026765 [Bulinus truncatus]